MVKQQYEEQALQEKQDVKDKCERLFKKRLQDKEAVWQKKFEDIEEEINDLNQAHH